MIKTIVHLADGGFGGGGGCGSGRGGAGMYHTSCSTGDVGAAADEVAPTPPVCGGATSKVRGDAHTMLCKDNAHDTSALTSSAIAHPALGANSFLTRVPSSLAVVLPCSASSQANDLVNRPTRSLQQFLSSSADAVALKHTRRWRGSQVLSRPPHCRLFERFAFSLTPLS